MVFPDKKATLIGCIVSLVLMGSVGVGQASAQRLGEIGVRAGYARASLHSNTGSTGAADGWMAGVSLLVPLDPAVAVEPALLYARKGGEAKNPTGTGGKVHYTLGYLELPLLGRLAVPISNAFGTYFSAGPYAALLLHHSTDTDLDEEMLLSSEQFENVDYGVVGAVSLEVPAGRHTAFLGVRYDYGVADLFQEQGEGAVRIDRTLNTRTLFITVGLRF